MKKLNQWLAASLVLTTALAPTSALAAPTTGTIADLQKADSWAQNAIVQVKDLGLMNGDPTGSFRPTDTITRAEFAVLLTRLMQVEVPASTTSSFADVPSGHWGLSYIEAVKNAGLMLGDGNGTFRPDDVITREELAVLLVKAGQGSAQDGELTVADQANVSSWAKGYVQAALSMGLMNGDGTNFNPKNTAQRQEVAQVAVNYVNKVPSKIDIVADSTVTVKGMPYQVSGALKPLFNVKNSAALKNAKMRFEIKDKVITKVTYLELVHEGQAPAAGSAEFSGNAVLDAGGATVDGHVKVSADYVSLLNLNVNGDFEVGEGVKHDFYSSKVKVSGKTVVNGGDENTVVFDGATLGAVEINKQNVHVKSANGTTVDQIQVNADARLEADEHVTLTNVTVGAGVKNLQLDGKGSVENLNVQDKSSKITLLPGTQVQNVKVPQGSQLSDVFANYDKAKDQIGKGHGNDNGHGTDNGNNGNSNGNGNGNSNTGNGNGNSNSDDSRGSNFDIYLRAMMALKDLPQPENITIENYQQVHEKLEWAQTMVAEFNARHSKYTLTNLDILAADLEKVDQLINQVNHDQFRDSAVQALAQLPDASEITYDNLGTISVEITAAVEAVSAARVNGVYTPELPGLDKLVKVEQLKVNKLFATDANGDLDKDHLAADFDMEKFYEVFDMFDVLLDPQSIALSGMSEADARHAYVEAMKRIVGLSDMDMAIYNLIDDLNLLYILEMQENFFDLIGMIPTVEQVTMADKGTLSFLLDLDQTITLTSMTTGQAIPNYGDWIDAEIKLYDASGALAPSVVEALFTDNTHTALASDITQGSLNEAKTFVDNADYSVKDDLYALLDVAQGLFANQEDLLPEILLAWTQANMDPSTWNHEIVIGDGFYVTANKNSKVYLVPNNAHPLSTEGLEALVADHKAAVTSVTGVGEGMTGEIPTAGLASGDYRLYMADNFGHVKPDWATYTLVDNVAPYVVWPIRDQVLEVSGPIPRIPIQFTFQDTPDDTLTYSATSSDPSICDVMVASLGVRLQPHAPGVVTITVTATDSRGATGSTTFKVTVNPDPPFVNQDPQMVNQLPDYVTKVGDEDQQFDLNNYFVDENPEDILSYSLAPYTDDSVATVSLENNVLTVHGVAPGMATVTLIASDGHGGTDATMTFHVNVEAADPTPSANHDPSVANTIDTQNQTIGDPDLTFDLNQVFSDEDGDALAYTLTYDGSEYADIQLDQTTGILTIRGLAPGTATVTLVASDGKSTNDATVTFQVNVTTQA